MSREEIQGQELTCRDTEPLRVKMSGLLLENYFEFHNGCPWPLIQVCGPGKYGALWDLADVTPLSQK